MKFVGMHCIPSKRIVNKGSSKVSNVEFEVGGVGNRKGSVGKTREGTRRGPPWPHLVFLVFPRHATSKTRDKAPDLANALITACVLE